MNIYKKFESLTAFEHYLQTNELQPYFAAYPTSQVKKDYEDSFYGTKSWDDAEDLMLHGDKESAKRIEDGGIAKERAKIKLSDTRRQLFHDVAGVMPHVPNYIAGVPACMVNVKQVRAKFKVITLVYNISVNGDVNAEDMRDVAIKMLSAIMRIESNGVRVNLYVCDISDTAKQQIGWLLKIKNSGQHLDVIKTAYPLTNPSMLRRHSFRFTEITKGVHKAFASGYGSANRRADELLKACGLRDAKVLSYYKMRGQTTEQITKDILS